MRSYKDVQDEILSECPNGYKLMNYCHDHNLTLGEFISLFLVRLNKVYDTYTVNAKVNHLVCEAGKRRSLADIFLICRYYYPECTLKDVREFLINSPAYSMFCEKSGKRVYFGLHLVTRGSKYNAFRQDEYGWTIISKPADV